MSIIQPRVFDCRKRTGGWPRDLSPEMVKEFILLSDVWPLDTFIAKGGILLTMDGDGYWTVRDPADGSSIRESDPRFTASSRVES